MPQYLFTVRMWVIYSKPFRCERHTILAPHVENVIHQMSWLPFYKKHMHDEGFVLKIKNTARVEIPQ